MTGTHGRRGLAAMLVAACLLVLAMAAPAGACACGAVERPADADELAIERETALVRHDGETEDLLLSFGMHTDADSAALILPLPARAELSLADADTFDELERITRPEVVHERVLRGLPLPDLGGSDGAGAPVGSDVKVLDTQRLGPFTATQLTSDDASALTGWLEEHDYRVREDIVDATQPYLDDDWVIAVIQLEPGAEDEAGFGGDLQPVRATFPTEEMVYPMRLQAQAEGALPLRVYTLTEHRMDARLGGQSLEVEFAGELTGASRPGEGTLAQLTQGTPYLTRFDTDVRPQEATTDLTFARHSSDAPFVTERVVTEDYPWFVRILAPSWGTALFWLVAGPFLLIGAAGITWLVVRFVRPHGTTRAPGPRGPHVPRARSPLHRGRSPRPRRGRHPRGARSGRGRARPHRRGPDVSGPTSWP